MKSKLFFVFFLFPMMFFSQRQISDYFSNKIDFVLDNDDGRKILGNIVAEHFKTDSTNHFYNKTGILPFYRYTESKFFNKEFLSVVGTIYNDKSSYNFTQHSGNYRNGTDYEFRLNVCRLCSFDIESNVIKSNDKANQYIGSTNFRFRNFDLSSSIDDGKSKNEIEKEYYSNIAVSQQGSMNIFDENFKEDNKDLIFYNTLSINYTDYVKKTNFLVKIYETIWGHNIGGPGEKSLRYLTLQQDLVMRKVEITGNKEEAVKYLKKNKLDDEEFFSEKFKEEDFKKKDK